jgi:AraC-like DNA-binding protein
MIKKKIRLLLETDLSISEIANGLEFSSLEYISRYFNKETGKEFKRIQKTASFCQITFYLRWKINN